MALDLAVYMLHCCMNVQHGLGEGYEKNDGEVEWAERFGNILLFPFTSDCISRARLRSLKKSSKGDPTHTFL